MDYNYEYYERNIFIHTVMWLPHADSVRICLTTELHVRSAVNWEDLCLEGPLLPTKKWVFVKYALHRSFNISALGGHIQLLLLYHTSQCCHSVVVSSCAVICCPAVQLVTSLGWVECSVTAIVLGLVPKLQDLDNSHDGHLGQWKSSRCWHFVACVEWQAIPLA